MIIYLAGLQYPYVVVMDTEHDQGNLIQFSGILLQRREDGLYKVIRSINFYIKKDELSDFTIRYTHITVDFLKKYGEDPDVAIDKFYNEFLEDIPLRETAFCSHGVRQDANVMREAGIGIDCCPQLCTYEMSKSILKRTKHLKLSDILVDAGMASVLEHNAYTDALGTLWALSYLLDVGGYKKIC